ncbi:MAG: GNAT family N-acetyltransferase, partial [Bacteroidota bacterium]|nr:GNAT family N-acetyltransferase [Bacteroidota bacterium]
CFFALRSMDMIQIREAGIADAAVIADLSRTTFFETFASQNTKADMDLFLEKQFSREMLMAQVGEPGNHFFLADYNEVMAGYVFLKTSLQDPIADAGTIEIARIYVSDSCIGKGVGKVLMQTALQFARSRNARHVRLAVWEQNHRAIRFYESFGFIRSGVQDFLLGTDVQHDFIMQLALAE